MFARMCMVLAACLALGSAQATTIHLDLDVPIDCGALPMVYCVADLGCQASSAKASYKTTCEKMENPPAINCTEQNAKVGGIVMVASKAYITALKALKDTSSSIAKNSSSSFDALGSSSSKYDDSLCSYNKSVVEQNKLEGQLSALQSQLDTLQATCSATTPPPPPSCPTDIEKLEEKIASMNATVAKAAIDVDSAHNLLNLAKGLMITAEKGAEAQASASADAFDQMTRTLMDLMKAKTDALTYWDVVNNACTSGAPSTQAHSELAAKKAHISRMAAKKYRKRTSSLID